MHTKTIPWTDPINVFNKVRHLPSSVLLDSSVNNSLGRFSIIAFDPYLELESRQGKTFSIQNRKSQVIKESFFEAIRKVLIKNKIDYSGKLPFYTGGIGYLGYELLNQVEKTARIKKSDIKIPEARFFFYHQCIIFDNLEKKVYLLATNQKKVKQIQGIVQNNKNPAVADSGKYGKTKLISNFTKKQYLKAVERIKRYIKEGDIYQVNLSQRFATSIESDPWLLYRKLRKISPNPFGGMLKYADFQILCGSPERFLKVRNRLVETRPMKGTRPRGKTKASDTNLQNELLRSPKDSAELLMITDLLRNDLGRVCEYGSVKVKKLKNLEKYSKVLQTTSLIQGKLHRSKDLIDLTKACFPGGSITGAPKIRAMQIISELEPTARGPYTGALGYISFNGNMDLNIIIRSILLKNKKAYFQVGGGIVADSDPKKEYKETLIKARAMIEALN